jgi:hypothetical protein
MTRHLSIRPRRGQAATGHHILVIGKDAGKDVDYRPVRSLEGSMTATFGPP